MYFLWCVVVIVVLKCYVDVFWILFKWWWIDNLFLKEILVFFFESCDLDVFSGENGLSGVVKWMVVDWVKIDMFMY